MIKVTQPDREQVVSLTDWHVPYESKTALLIAFRFCELIKPKIIIIHEAHDFYALSKFDKDPNRLGSLQEEIDKTLRYFSILRMKCPEARIILLESNHLRRMKKYLMRKAPELYNLRSLEIVRLLELEKYNIEYKSIFIYKGVIFKHGDKVNKHSSMTARNEFYSEMVSGMSGHTHRLGQFYTRKRGGMFTWVECGCLCELDPDYIEGVSDWQHGFGLVNYINKSSRFEAMTIPIIDNKISWGGYCISYETR